jgi:AcrR family transcriptional regulator
MGQRPLTSERAGQRRQELLRTALEVFGERDYDDVSMDEIAAAAGVSHGLLFQYFGTKKGLYIATIEPLIAEFRRRIAPDPELPPVDRLRSAVRSYAEFAAEHPVGYRNLIRNASSFGEVRDGLERARWEGVERLAGQMGLDAGRPEVRVGLRAWIGYLDTAILAWVETGGPDVDVLVELVAHALGGTARAIDAKGLSSG